MFLVCNYLDVERIDSRTDGFVVEECGEYDNSLSDLVIVCREHRIANVKEWACSQMGNKATLFERQFKINPTKAMTFVRLKLRIPSFTEELVNQAGGTERFKELYDVKPIGILSKPEETTEENSVIVGESVAQSESIPEVPVQEVSVQEVPVQEVPVQEVSVQEVSIQEEAVREASIQKEAVPGESEQGTISTYLAVHPQCHTTCIYNTDGTFKGFTEGQILTMLEHLHALDKRIALDSLNPKYVLSAEELEEASKFLDSISPSVFKAFILYEASQAESETDRIRISAILDRFSSYMSTMQV